MCRLCHRNVTAWETQASQSPASSTDFRSRRKNTTGKPARSRSFGHQGRARSCAGGRQRAGQPELSPGQLLLQTLLSFFFLFLQDFFSITEDHRSNRLPVGMAGQLCLYQGLQPTPPSLGEMTLSHPVAVPTGCPIPSSSCFASRASQPHGGGRKVLGSSLGNGTTGLAVAGSFRVCWRGRIHAPSATRAGAPAPRARSPPRPSGWCCCSRSRGRGTEPAGRSLFPRVASRHGTAPASRRATASPARAGGELAGRRSGAQVDSRQNNSEWVELRAEVSLQVLGPHGISAKAWPPNSTFKHCLKFTDLHLAGLPALVASDLCTGEQRLNPYHAVQHLLLPLLPYFNAFCCKTLL